LPLHFEENPPLNAFDDGVTITFADVVELGRLWKTEAIHGTMAL